MQLLNITSWKISVKIKKKEISGDSIKKNRFNQEKLFQARKTISKRKTSLNKWKGAEQKKNEDLKDYKVNEFYADITEDSYGICKVSRQGKNCKTVNFTWVDVYSKDSNNEITLAHGLMQMNLSIWFQNKPMLHCS